MKLSAKKVERVKTPGRYGDGNGLYLQVVSPTNKSWLLRFERDGRERWLSLGPLHTFTLAEARDRARSARQLLADGIDPMLLADGEARTLNKLFAAEQSILLPDFGSKLSVLLEDHIGLRSFYPEVERHYHAVNTGRLIQPLSRDAVEAIQKVIRSQTPAVFDETVSPAIDEAAKPFPEIQPPLPEDVVPDDPNRPKPPSDPIADADPRNSRSFTIASAYNRIWSIL